MRDRRQKLPPYFLLAACWLVAAFFSAAPTLAQDLCSGRCFPDASCGLSAFGHVRCVENYDFCVEFRCTFDPYAAANGTLPAAATPRIGTSLQCAESSPLPALESMGQVKVLRLKARS
jgi:hypothetical protein